jgi:hypothetical protein
MPGAGLPRSAFPFRRYARERVDCEIDEGGDLGGPVLPRGIQVAHSTVTSAEIIWLCQGTKMSQYCYRLRQSLQGVTFRLKEQKSLCVAAA